MRGSGVVTGCKNGGQERESDLRKQREWREGERKLNKYMNPPISSLLVKT